MSAYDPSSFLELAERLIDDKDYDQSGRTRTAVGRAYYASFLMVKGKLEQLGSSFPDEHRIHEQVIKKLKERNHHVGDLLDTLRTYRVNADYHMNSLLNPAIGRNCLTVSRKVIHSLKEIK